MYFVLVKDISTGQIVDKAEITATDNLGGEVAHIAWLTKHQFENRYPSEKYDVVFREAETWEELRTKLKSEFEHTGNADDGNEVFTLIGSRTYLLLVNIAALIGGMFLLFFLLVFRLIFNPFIFIIGLLILFFYFYIDYKRWMRKGIHKIKIDMDGLTLFKGVQDIETRIDKKQITGIDVFKKMNRRIVNILLGGYADSSIPGVTLFSGPRIRITDDAFNEAEFGIFIDRLKELKKEYSNN